MVNRHQPGIVQRLPERELESAELAPADRQHDELLDVLGTCAFAVGVLEAADGNPETGAKLALAGLAAVGGPRVLREYLKAM